MRTEMRQEMLEQRPLPLLLKYAIPAIIGMMVMAIYNIVDRIFIGNYPSLGSAGLAAAAVGFPINIIVSGIGLLFANGGGTSFAIALGEGDNKKAEDILHNVFVLSLVSGFIVMLLGNLFIEDLLHMLGASDAILPLSKEYFSVIFYGTPFSMLAYYGNNFSRAQGNPRNTMQAMVFGAVFNIVFDYIFIFIFHMGMFGAALATVLGQVCTCFWQMRFLWSERSIIPLRFQDFRFRWDIAKKATATGLPVFFIQVGAGGVSFLLNALAKTHGGDLGLSVVSVYSSLQSMIQMPIVGVTQGQTPILGYCYGAKRPDRIRGVLGASMRVSTSYTLLCFVLIQLFAKELVQIFNQEPAFVALATSNMRLAFACIPLLGLQMVSANVFQATRQIRQSSVLNMLRQVLLFAPLAYVLSGQMGFSGIFLAQPIADALALGITLVLLWRLLKRMEGKTA